MLTTTMMLLLLIMTMVTNQENGLQAAANASPTPRSGEKAACAWGSRFWGCGVTGWDLDP